MALCLVLELVADTKKLLQKGEARIAHGVHLGGYMFGALFFLFFDII